MLQRHQPTVIKVPARQQPLRCHPITDINTTITQSVSKHLTSRTKFVDTSISGSLFSNELSLSNKIVYATHDFKTASCTVWVGDLSASRMEITNINSLAFENKLIASVQFMNHSNKILVLTVSGAIYILEQDTATSNLQVEIALELSGTARPDRIEPFTSPNGQETFITLHSDLCAMWSALGPLGPKVITDLDGVLSFATVLDYTVIRKLTHTYVAINQKKSASLQTDRQVIDVSIVRCTEPTENFMLLLMDFGTLALYGFAKSAICLDCFVLRGFHKLNIEPTSFVAREVKETVNVSQGFPLNHGQRIKIFPQPANVKSIPERVILICIASDNNLTWEFRNVFIAPAALPSGEIDYYISKSLGSLKFQMPEAGVSLGLPVVFCDDKYVTTFNYWSEYGDKESSHITLIDVSIDPEGLQAKVKINAVPSLSRNILAIPESAHLALLIGAEPLESSDSTYLVARENFTGQCSSSLVLLDTATIGEATTDDENYSHMEEEGSAEIYSVPLVKEVEEPFIPRKEPERKKIDETRRQGDLKLLQRRGSATHQPMIQTTQTMSTVITTEPSTVTGLFTTASMPCGVQSAIQPTGYPEEAEDFVPTPPGFGSSNLVEDNEPWATTRQETNNTPELLDQTMTKLADFVVNHPKTFRTASLQESLLNEIKTDVGLLLNQTITADDFDNRLNQLTARLETLIQQTISLSMHSLSSSLSGVVKSIVIPAVTSRFEEILNKTRSQGTQVSEPTDITPMLLKSMMASLTTELNVKTAKQLAAVQAETIQRIQLHMVAAVVDPLQINITGVGESISSLGKDFSTALLDLNAGVTTTVQTCAEETRKQIIDHISKRPSPHHIPFQQNNAEIFEALEIIREDIIREVRNIHPHFPPPFFPQPPMHHPLHYPLPPNFPPHYALATPSSSNPLIENPYHTHISHSSELTSNTTRRVAPKKVQPLRPISTLSAHREVPEFSSLSSRWNNGAIGGVAAREDEPGTRSPLTFLTLPKLQRGDLNESDQEFVNSLLRMTQQNDLDGALFRAVARDTTDLSFGFWTLLASRHFAPTEFTSEQRRSILCGAAKVLMGGITASFDPGNQLVEEGPFFTIRGKEYSAANVVFNLEDLKGRLEWIKQALLMLEEASGNTLEVKELRHLIQKDAILVENGLDRTKFTPEIKDSLSKDIHVLYDLCGK